MTIRGPLRHSKIIRKILSDHARVVDLMDVDQHRALARVKRVGLRELVLGRRPPVRRSQRQRTHSYYNATGLLCLREFSTLLAALRHIGDEKFQVMHAGEYVLKRFSALWIRGGIYTRANTLEFITTVAEVDSDFRGKIVTSGLIEHIILNIHAENVHVILSSARLLFCIVYHSEYVQLYEFIKKGLMHTLCMFLTSNCIEIAVKALKTILLLITEIEPEVDDVLKVMKSMECEEALGRLAVSGCRKVACYANKLLDQYFQRPESDIDSED